MDEERRQKIMDRAYAALERTENYQSYQPRDPSEPDALVEWERLRQQAERSPRVRFKERSASEGVQPGDVIYKIVHDRFPDDSANDWFAKSFANFAAAERQWVMDKLETVVEIIAEETAKLHSGEVKKLREEIGQLRADVEILRTYKANVVDMKRDRDVA